MPTVDRVLPWRRNDPPPADEVAPLLVAFRRRHPKAPTALITRAYLQSADAHRGQSRNSGEPYVQHPLAVARIVAELGLDDVTDRRRPAARHGRGHRRHARRDRARLRRRRRRDRRRRHQARAGPVRLQGGPAGRHHAQDAGGDGQGPAGPDHQARRPSAQHAHDRGDAGVEAGAHRPGDARHLRAAGPPPRHAGRQAAARGPGLRRPAPQALRRDRPHGRRPARPSATSTSPRCSRRCAPRLAELRITAEVTGRPKHLWSIYEKMVVKGREFDDIFDLVGHPGRRRVGQGLLRGARLDPRHVEAGAGAVQGLHRHAQVQPLPVVAHDGGRAPGQAARGADPHVGDARPGRVGRGRPLGLQGAATRTRSTCPGSTASSTGSRRPPIPTSSWPT